MPADPSAVPDVSVVVIVYNDAGRLPAAVRSVLGQTLRNLEVLIVDDCSTDATPQVAAKLAGHPKVRSLRLERNSGGCSAPRNAGIEQARGRYVMFLDSDDTLDRHACLNLLRTAEDTGADLVSGGCVRVLHNRSGLIENVPWWPDLYAERRVLDGVAQLPDLLRDTLSTNKLYRRGLLEENALRFPVGFHYEDLLFSAKAYLAARRIALIPQTVYRWNVTVRAAERSISNRRDEIANARDRLRIHELIDEALDAWLATPAGDREVKIAKGAKFLEHDLVLYLRDLPYRDSEYIAEFSSLMRGYLRTLSPESFDRCPHRVAVVGASLLMRDDWPNLMTVCEHLLDRTRDSAKRLETTRITSDLVREGDRVFWCRPDSDDPDDPDGRAALDVTSLGLHLAAFPQANLGTRLTGLERLPGSTGRVRISGETVNPLGLVPADARLSAVLEFRPAARAVRVYPIKAASVRHEGSRIVWSAEADLTGRIKPVGLIDQVWELTLRLSAEGLGTAVAKVTSLALPGGGSPAATVFPARPLLTRAVGDVWTAGISHRGAVTFTLGARNPVARAVNAPFAGAGGAGGGPLLRAAQRLNRRAQILNDPRVKREVYRRFLIRLPIRRGSVVFESHLGQSYSDSPKYIHQALRSAGHKGRVYWSHRGGTAGFPPDATLVKRSSWAYLRALARAEFWIDNQGFPPWIEKRPGTTYLQTWHGTALKSMGANTPQVKAMLAADRAKLAAAVGRFDYFLIRSDYDIKTLIEAFGARAEPLRTGYPRNDPLCAADRAERGARLRRDLGIPDDRVVLLYAPTFRQGSGTGGATAVFEPGFDLSRFARRFGDTHLLLVRAHYLNRVEVPKAAAGAVRDVSAHPDVTELMLASDALITDYSSVMFDFALLDRPMLFFVPDAASYAQDRGTYFELADRAPGPVVGDQDGLFAEIAALASPVGGEAGAESRADSFALARKAFAHDFGEYDQGTAAAQILARFFPGADGTRSAR